MFNDDSSLALTYSHAKRLLSVDSDPKALGRLVWVLSRKSATQRTKGGRGIVKVGGFIYSSARIVWLLTFGEYPVGQVKRRNKVLTDDRPENLYAIGIAGNVYPEQWPAFCDGVFLGMFPGRESADAARELHRRTAWDRGEDLF